MYVEGHGCSASFADAEIISGLISQSEYELVQSEEKADLCILVTCSVKSVTEDRMLARITDLVARDRKVVVAGCLPKAQPQKVARVDSNLSMIGPGNLDKVLPAISSTLAGKKFVSLEDSKLVKPLMPRTRQNQVVGIVEIASGCLSSCTFCQVKLVKGTVFSYPEENIVAEVRVLVSQGAREIWLTSTDNAAYGRDSKTTLASLLRKVCAIEGDFKVRVGMMNPLLARGAMIEELVEAFRHEKVFQFLHLPVQSGSDRILKLMQRGYTIDDFLATVDCFRHVIPDLTLSTDIIVGFPTESETDFEQSLELLEKSRPDIVNLSRFGAREGTKAARMKGQISASVSRERSGTVDKIWKKIALQNNQRWVGWRGPAFVDERVKGGFVARNAWYKPCLIKIDGDDLKKRQGELLGTVQEVTVTDATSFTLHTHLNDSD